MKTSYFFGRPNEEKGREAAAKDEEAICRFARSESDEEQKETIVFAEKKYSLDKVFSKSGKLVLFIRQSSLGLSGCFSLLVKSSDF